MSGLKFIALRTTEDVVKDLEFLQHYNGALSKSAIIRMLITEAAREAKAEAGGQTNG